MIFTRLLLSSALGFGLTSAAFADPILEETLEVEEIPNKKLERRGERIKGPITAVSAGAMVFAGFDSNTDYAVTQAELEAGLTKSFKAA